MAATPITPEQQKCIEAQNDTADSIAWWTNIMILVSAGLLLLAFAPDSLVVSDNAETEMPFIGSASIKLVLISGPLVLLLIRLFLSSYLHHWNKLEAEIGHLKPKKELTLTLMQNKRLRRWAGFIHFPMVVLVFITTTWKGLAFPLWGELMAAITIVVAAWLTYRAARTGRWFNLGMLLILLAVTPTWAYYQLMEPVPGDEGGTATSAVLDDDEDNYRGSLFFVQCSSPRIAGPGTVANGHKHGEGNGCIGMKKDWNLQDKDPEPEPSDSDENGDHDAGPHEAQKQEAPRTVRDRIRNLLTSIDRFFVIQRQLDLSGADMERADLRYLNLRWSSMTHANLSHALLRSARLQHATATDADFTGANFGYAQMQNANLRRAKLREARFWKAQLQKANLENANLRDARLLTSNLQYANLERAKLQGAHLRSSNLSRANFRQAKLQNAHFGSVGDRSVANLTCADLAGANLKGAVGLTQAQLDRACMDEHTQVPDHLEKSYKCQYFEGRDKEDLPPICPYPVSHAPTRAVRFAGANLPGAAMAAVTGGTPDREKAPVATE